MTTYAYEKINKELLPYKLKKRMAKTSEGRGGSGIYKRRNKRNYRVLIQYPTWKKLINNPDGENILNKYKQGYVVYIKPEEYFEDKNKISKELDEKFVLGQTGFIYYTLLEEYLKFPPLNEWEQVFELDTEGKLENDNTWTGHCVLNIKNGDVDKSIICGSSRSATQRKEIRKYVNKKCDLNRPLEKIPEQCGLGNNDFDYADEETIENVKYQMLYLLLNSKTKDGQSAQEYIYDTYQNQKSKICHKDDTKKFKEYMENKPKSEYLIDFEKQLKKIKEKCEKNNLLNFERLENDEVKVWDSKNSQPICPLCHKPIYINNFFETIDQTEGRQVADNTQTEIVLMHIKALTPGEFNHSPYNLGWGHNYCNLIQGNDDISVTIKKLKKIIGSHESL